MASHDAAAWIRLLRSIAAPLTAEPPTDAGPIGRPFRAAVCGEGAEVPDVLPADDVGLWWALASAGSDVDALLPDGSGPLWPGQRRRGLEVWTEVELAGLHALWRLARRDRRPDWSRRVDRARAWHLENTQPDNATNRPWALHVFLLAGSDEGRFYAETLLHNAMATGGRPDRLSAWILEDAARCLELALAG